MNHTRLFRFLSCLLFLLLAAPLATTQAQEPPTATPTATSTVPTLSITAVQPALIASGTDTEIVVTGNGFMDGAAVILGNGGSLSTTFVSSNLLRAIVPATLPTGAYDLTVVNPNASIAVLPKALTITAPANATPDATSTPAPTAFVRPLLIVSSYGASSGEIAPNTNYDFEMTLTNAGAIQATNVVATFASGDFVARDTGGVRALGNLVPGQSNRFWQPLRSATGLTSGGIATLEVKVDYTDVNGTAYSETFALTFPVRRASSGSGAAPTVTPTVTPTTGPRLRPQLIVTGYSTSASQLQPGTTFTLTLAVQNQGNAAAERITMIVGGGTVSGGSVDGTAVPGGVSGGGGEFSKFAPLGASNVQTLGDLDIAASLNATMQFVVNAATDPGAYPLKVSFVYEDPQRGNFVDDQVVTLLVVRRPSVQMNFYAPPPPFFAGQPGSLPLQVVNVGNRSAVLGSFSVLAAGGTIENGNVFVGNLEPGGFYPLDALFFPEAEGVQELTLSIGYTDDFGQSQIITQTLPIEVLPPMVFEETTDFPIEPLPVEPVEETMGQRLWRFFLGLIGLSSGQPQANDGSGGLEGIPGNFEGAPGDFAVPVQEQPLP